MIAETTALRLIEVDREGQIHKGSAESQPSSSAYGHSIDATNRGGNYLVCHEGDGTVREYDGKTGNVVWEFEVPMLVAKKLVATGPKRLGNKTFAAVRLDNGNTLLTTGNGHSVLEVTPGKEIVWQIDQDSLPSIRLAWVTTIEVLQNGNYVIGNCHAGPGQPLLIEIEPKTKQVVWTLDRFSDFGNSVSNSQNFAAKHFTASIGIGPHNRYQ